jgi:rhamnulokinase
MSNHVAVDVGSNGGTIWVGRRDGDQLDVTEVHRFDNGPVERDGRYVWDTAQILDDIASGLVAAERECGHLDTVAVETTGLDFTFFADDQPIRDPYFYRDPAVTSTLDDILAKVDKRDIFAQTGINHWNVPNSLWQYHYQTQASPSVVDAADTFVMLPQIFTHAMGGTVNPDKSIASTSQMFDIESETWATDLLDELGLRADLLPELKEPGTTVGTLDESFAPSLDSRPDILLTTTHDTACAVAATPFDVDERTFLCTGSWFIVGIELEEPRVTDDAFAVEASNEYGAEGTTRFLKDVTGFNLLEYARETWEREGKPHEYDAMINAMADTEPFGPLLDPDDDLFVAGTLEGDIIDKIERYCLRTDQRVPSGVGEITRCLLESLAAKTAYALSQLQGAAGVESEQLNVVGGGVHNEPFLRMMAGATGLPVVAGPIEATSIGNLLVQMNATDEIANIAEGRRLIRETMPLDEYAPRNRDEWTAAIERMASLVDR